MGKEITSRSEDYSQWYIDLVKKADLAENSDVRGCMVIKPYGYGIWEKMQQALDKMFKDTGHSNAYFPLFIPKSFLAKEASHVEGFAKECAIVTHYRLKNAPDGNGVIVDPDAKLEEELIIRPTSETVIWNSYKKWIQSYRDLPILINQWCNVVRWEMRTRLFLRTAEFLWQEGHTAHATADEAVKETRQMLDVYADFAENFMAVPVIKGKKSEGEKFPGAIDTYCIEALMQDGKALQAGTSHFLGQNFAKAFDVQFTNKEGKLELVWGTSWGVSTRLMGALIMAHSDDDGLVLPPKLAPIHVVIVPIFKTEEEPGFKFAEHEMRGVPVRIAIGPRDLENGTVEVARRDTKEKQVMKMDDVVNEIPKLLDAIQLNIYQKALKFRNDNTLKVDSYDEFKKILDEKPGFVLAHWDGTKESEASIKEETKATIRCIPLDSPEENGKCIYSGKPSSRRVLFARAY
ncbi:MAG: proline--tRNA ligase [Bacteroidetes bacterium]|nr:proline--tRNA ligase [Bacteroidota bacterium]